MNSFDEELPTVYLKPGEMYFTEKPALVITVLGSCLSVTMFNRRMGIGAICHGLLPRCKKVKYCNGNCMEGFRYIDCSIHRMIEKFRRQGVKKGEIEIKIFGGAGMFGINNGGNIGKQNIETAIAIFKAKKMKILTSDVGGVQGRKILFFTHIGDVLLKRLERTDVLIQVCHGSI